MKRLVHVSIIAACTLLPTWSGAASFFNRVVGTIEPPPDSLRNCAFFQLVGVAGADPNAPTDAWFALPRSHLGFAEIYAALLVARLNGMTVSVHTTGAPESTCSGHYGVSTLILD